MSAINPPEMSKSDHAGVAFPPPLLLGICVLMGFIARRFSPQHFVPEALSAIIGPVMVGTSFALCFWAINTLSRCGTTVDIRKPSTTVVSDGPFRFSRNPIYLSSSFLQIGIGVWANSLWFVGIALLSGGLLTWGVILREERYLENKFGPAYMSYRASVRRWL